MLKLQYDGTDYSGWQIQPNAITVQQVIEDTIFKVTGEKCTVYGCGRTDSGVHALGYVCNFKTNSLISCDKLMSALNALTSDDIVVFSCTEVPQDFHSRYNSKKKTYVYTIDNSKYGNVFLRKYSWHYPHSLDVKKMQDAASLFCGEHDFCAFMASGSSVSDTVRHVYSCDVKKDGDTVTIEVCGNGFLYNMVRILAGTLVYIGNDRITDSMADIISGCDRTKCGPTAPAHGLCMKNVQYGGEIDG